MDVRCWCLLVLLVLAVSWRSEGVQNKHGNKRLRSFHDDLPDLMMGQQKHSLVEEIAQQLRSRRQTGNGLPTPHGDYLFQGDNNRFARIYYSGNSSPVILVLTYDSQNPTRTNLYRSTNYGASFQNIDSQLGSPLWSGFYTSTSSKLVIFAHTTRSTIYISQDEGATWTTRNLFPNTIDPRSLVWNPRQEGYAVAHDGTNGNLYVTDDFGQSWIKIASNVNSRFDYQWGNEYDGDNSVVYYNSYDPNDRNRGDFTVGLYSQRSPYTDVTQREVDPNLGRHDDFLLLGPYIFAQRNDSGNIHLYISYLRNPFNRTKIPTNDAHQNYYVAHINGLQALVIVQHTSGQFNLYLSDITGVYFSLSLADIVISQQEIDLELIDGINGTMIANRYEHVNATSSLVRTVITLDNGGEWRYISPPETDLTGTPILCEPPSCSLHFHMDSSAYARLGVYSQESAPGIIIAHGSLGATLSTNPDLYISRDGGVSWSQTLTGSYGVTVVDHGGLLVAADDYHKEPSSVLKYSCNEGISWTNFTFTTTAMTVYGVITEPGEETTTVSLYGVKQGTGVWDVVTVNFSSIFPTTCTANDFYLWQPWDARTESDCILGLDVTLERRLPQRCCLIGINYDRPVSVSQCECNIDDYECDYAFKPANGLNGPCVRDEAVPLDDPCADGLVKTVMKSQGYRKVAGDLCTKGSGSPDFDPYEFTCCSADAQPTNTSPIASASATNPSHSPSPSAIHPSRTPSASATNPSPSASPSHPTTQSPNVSVIVRDNKSLVTGLGIALAIAIVVAIILGLVAAIFVWRHSQQRSRYLRSGHVEYRGSVTGGEDSEKLLGNSDEEDDDDPPLAL